MKRRDITDFDDIHTHNRQTGANAVINLYAGEEPDDAGRFYSIGIHPWHTAGMSDARLDELIASMRLSIETHPNIVAVGEAGIDRLRGAGPERQEEIFLRQIGLSREYDLPLIIHAVKSYDRLIALRRRLRPSQRWIIHGFRGKPELARMLLDAGFDLSLGRLYNPATLIAIPASRRFAETDEDF